MDKLYTLRLACTVDLATESIAAQYGLSLSAVRFLSLCYSIEQTGAVPRSKTIKTLGYYSSESCRVRTAECMQHGYLYYRPGTQRGLMLTTAGKLLCNAFAREIERHAQRLQKI